MGDVIIKSPTPEGYIVVSGRVAYLTFGSRKRYKVLLQDEPAYLLDYRTGYCIPSTLSNDSRLAHEAIYIMARHSTSHKRDPRTCAQLRLDLLIAQKGEEAIFAVLDATPTLNED